MTCKPKIGSYSNAKFKTDKNERGKKQWRKCRGTVKEEKKGIKTEDERTQTDKNKYKKFAEIIRTGENNQKKLKGK